MRALLELEAEQLELALEQADSDEERDWLYAELRAVARELIERDRWRSEGQDRGWTP